MKRAFSLIEILLVVALLVVLMAFLAPRYLGGKDPATGKKIASPRERAKAVEGVSYVSQINQAIEMYKSDNEDQLPPNLQELKVYGITEEMLLDPVTKQPLAYDPQTGRVGAP